MRMTSPGSLVSLAILVSLAPAATARADDAALDPTFTDGVSGSGRAALPFDAGGGDTDIAVKVLRTTDGKYVVVGTVSLNDTGSVGIGLARYTTTGGLDPAFAAGAGSRVKDACFGAVRNAALDHAGRIVVVGDVLPACSGNAFSDAGVVRFNADGSDDTTFAGDGGIGFKFDPANDGADSAGALVVLPDDSLIVGGSVKTTGNRIAVMQKIAANGAVAATPAAFGLPTAADTNYTDATLSPSGTSTWLSQRLTNSTLVAGAIKRVNNATLAADTSFGGAGEQAINIGTFPGYNACPGSHFAKALVRFGTTIKVFGFAQGSTPNRSWFAGVREANGAVLTYGCLESPGGGTVEFATTAAVDSTDAGGSIYLAGQCSLNLSFCIWRTTKRAGSIDDLEADPTFNGGSPVLTTFPAASSGTPGGIATSIIKDGAKTVATGGRLWSGADYDFATVRYGTGAAGDGIFLDGFE